MTVRGAMVGAAVIALTCAVVYVGPVRAGSDTTGKANNPGGANDERLAKEPGDTTRPAFIPSSWRRLPAVAKAASAAASATAGAPDAHAEAWGDPAAGCFALTQTLRVIGAETDAPAAVRAARAALAPPATPTGAATTTTDDSAKRWPFATNSARGVASISARAVDGGFLHITSASCFFNQRSPKYCEALCKRVMDGFASR